MSAKLVTILCVFVCLEVVFAGKAQKKDEYEDVYGDMGEADVQKDGAPDYYDDYTDNNNVNDNAGVEVENIKLLSKSAVFANQIGESVLLPCESTSNDPVRVWKKGLAILYQGSVNTQDKKNLKLHPNGSLSIQIEDPSDYGIYYCTLLVSVNERPTVTYELIDRNPRIASIRTQTNETVFSVGDELTLTCQAEGNHNVKITWHKNNVRLAPEGETITIPSLTATDGGLYRCLADKGNGIKPDHMHIEIFVNHAPIVSVQEYLVNSDHLNDVEFVCKVDAYPAPQVQWRRDNSILNRNEPKIKIMHEDGNSRNTLVVKDLSERDFGTYSCIATNAYGSETKNISLVRIPVVRKLEKNINESTKDVILQWKVESKQAITSHELQYRRKGETTWKTISPAVSAGENDVYLIKHTLKNLDPGIYETRARSKNSHGWSNYSEIMPFEGNSSLDTPAQHRSEGTVGESVSASTHLYSSTCLLSVATFFLVYFQFRQLS